MKHPKSKEKKKDQKQDDYGSCPVCGKEIKNGQYQCGCLWR